MTITIKDIKGDVIGEYRWDDIKGQVVYNSQTDNKTYNKILNNILELDSFFDPETESIINDKSLDYFDGFVTKVTPELFKYGFKYSIS